MSVQIYHNPRCSKSRQTLALLEEQDITPEVILYLETPPSAAEVEHIAKKLNISPRALIRDKEELFKELSLKNAQYSDAEWAVIIAKHPKLLERPIVIHGNKAAIGRPPENVLPIL